MNRCLLLLLLSSMITGCAVTYEGVGSAPLQYGIDEALDIRRGDRSGLVGSKQPYYKKNDPISIILIGNASVLRRFKPGEHEMFYEGYKEFAQNFHPDMAPSISIDTFKTQFLGWTMLKTASIPMVYGAYEDALIPVDIGEHIVFATKTSSVLAQSTADLLMARSNADGFLVVESILCKKDDEFSECRKQFQAGIFDALTGVELDQQLVLKKNGVVIDIEDFRIVVSTEG